MGITRDKSTKIVVRGPLLEGLLASGVLKDSSAIWFYGHDFSAPKHHVHRQNHAPHDEDSETQEEVSLKNNLHIGSMYGIFDYICHKNQLNVGIYTIHGSHVLLTGATFENHLSPSAETKNIAP